MDNKTLNILLKDIEVFSKNKIKQVIINTLLNPAYKAEKTFTIPPIKLEGIETGIVGKLINEFKKIIPEFLSQAHILPAPIPDYEKYTLHFVKKYEVGEKRYLYIFKIHLKYEGGGEPIVLTENPDKFLPGYKTNKIYYNAMLIPVEKIIEEDNEIISFRPCQYLKGIKKIETSTSQFLGSEIFDQQDFTELNNELNNNFYSGNKEFNPIAGYYPLKYKYTTVALNLLYPDEKTIDRYLPIFDKITRILLDDEKKDILSKEDNSRIKSLFSIYKFDRKVNENADIFWEVSF